MGQSRTIAYFRVVSLESPPETLNSGAATPVLNPTPRSDSICFQRFGRLFCRWREGRSGADGGSG